MKRLWMIGLLALAGADEHEWREPRLVRVVGEAWATREPDRAVVVLGVETADGDFGIAKRLNDNKVERLADLAAPFMLFQDRIEIGYLDAETVRGLDGTVVTYRVRKAVAFTLLDVSSLEEFLVEAMDRGATTILEVRFGLGDPEEARRAARDLALADAGDQAEGLAAALGARVLGPWSVSETAHWSAPAMGWEEGLLTQDLAGGPGPGLSWPAPSGRPGPLAPRRITVAVRVAAAFEIE